jgi:hypothetical protein
VKRMGGGLWDLGGFGKGWVVSLRGVLRRGDTCVSIEGVL